MREIKEDRVFWRLRVAFWVLEIIEVIFAIVILGVTGSASAGFLNDLNFPRVPAVLNYNIAVVSAQFR
jgi:hypothetical protein